MTVVEQLMSGFGFWRITWGVVDGSTRKWSRKIHGVNSRHVINFACDWTSPGDFTPV